MDISEIQNQVDSYLIGKIDEWVLESWLVTHLQEILDSGDDALIRMANVIDVGIIQLGEGIIDQPALKRWLEPLILEAQTYHPHYTMRQAIWRRLEALWKLGQPKEERR